VAMPAAHNTNTHVQETNRQQAALSRSPARGAQALLPQLVVVVGGWRGPYLLFDTWGLVPLLPYLPLTGW
jgi:hypothetical protein